MLNTEFYKLLDQELSNIIDNNSSNQALNKHKNKEQNKPYAFLMWFLNFYGETIRYSTYITEGKGDNSCDIILDVEDIKQGTIYYIVQSKWNNAKNVQRFIDATEFKSALEDFKLIFLGQKENTANDSFNRQYAKLTRHIENNGLVKFVYLSLSQANPEFRDNIKSFEKETGSTIQVLDINRIKRDYIDVHYKKIIPTNPLEMDYTPNEEIRLNIEQLGIKANYLKIEKPYDAYIFLVRPKTIFELFEIYKFKLFFKNVRNPLMISKVNENIEDTLQHEIPNFWYFNNGITALTQDIDNHINPTAKSIKISGLQVINGAQTVYSIYKSYKKASIRERKILDKQALVSLRLLVVNSDALSMKITKFTNSQNPLSSADFWANDDIQIQLQQESLETNYWYAKRKGEFREKPKGVTTIPNKLLTLYHLAFNLEKPVQAAKSLINGHDYLFMSRKEHRNGLYEEIFIDSPIRYKDMLAAYVFAEHIKPYILQPESDIATTNFLHTLALSKILFKKYLIWKFARKNENKNINVNQFILDSQTKTNNDLWIKIASYVNELTYDYLGFQDDWQHSTDKIVYNKWTGFLYNPIKFELLRLQIEDLIFTDNHLQKIKEQDVYH